MRGSIRKWMVVGVLASASLLFPACKGKQQERGEMQTETGTGGAGGGGMEEQGGTGGAGGAKKKGTKGAAMDAGTPAPADAGMGGGGFEEQNQEPGTEGQGVTGGSESGGTQR